MKILCIGDLHITGDKPENRKDNYWETVKKKLCFILGIANEQRVDLIASPGDFTDTPNLSYLEFGELVYLLKNHLNPEIKILATYGQHDMRYRTKPNTALKALTESVDNFIVITKESSPYRFGDIYFYASAYNEEIPDKKNPENKALFHVLLTHRMIIEEKLWAQQTEYEAANLFLRQNDFELIVSGDNHQFFWSHTPGGRWLINCGAMMRNKIDMVDFHPSIVLFDTKTRVAETIEISVDPPEEVFKMEKVEIEKERNEKLDAFISGLDQPKEIALSFEDNLIAYIKQNNIDKDVAQIALSSLGR